MSGPSSAHRGEHTDNGPDPDCTCRCHQTTIAILAALTTGYLLGRAATTRRCARLLRDAANLINPQGDTQ